MELSFKILSEIKLFCFEALIERMLKSIDDVI